jgi:hypothetical protein
MRPQSTACDALVQPGGPLFGRLEPRTSLQADEFGERMVCWSIALQREVLLRVLPTATTAATREQLTALRGLEHPKVMPMLEWGEHLRMPWLTSERIRGSRLADTHLADGATLALDEFVPIVAQVLMAVGHAHERGIGVGPITARNVSIVDHAGRSLAIRLADFGLARLLPRVHGRPPVPAAAHDETSTDVFEIGLLMRELLYGSGDASVVRDDLPAALVALIDDMLHGDAHTRPNDGNAVVERLIDAVPKSLFKLPSARGSGRSEESTAFGRLPTKRPSTVDTIPATPPPEPVAARSTVDTGSQSYVAASIEPAPRRRWIAALVVGTLGIGSALAIGLLPENDVTEANTSATDTSATIAATTTPPTPNPPTAIAPAAIVPTDSGQAPAVGAPPMAPATTSPSPAAPPDDSAPIVVEPEPEPEHVAKRPRDRTGRRDPPAPAASAPPAPAAPTAATTVTPKPPKSTALLVDGAQPKPRSSALLGVDAP